MTGEKSTTIYEPLWTLKAEREWYKVVAAQLRELQQKGGGK